MPSQAFDLLRTCQGKERTILIRIGFEIAIDCPKPTPMLLAMYPHLLNNRRMIGSDHIRTEPEAAVEEYADMFGNRCARLQAPPGATTLWSDCIVEDTGEPDEFNWNARQHEIVDLPVETLAYLTASRYCESDELIERAWDLFGATPPGWARVQAISNWVHNHVIFGYRFGRPTKTAIDVLREGTGVCRDFAHLFIALCRAINIPARFKAAVMGAGISNWVSFTGTTDIPHEMSLVHWNRWWYDNQALYWRRSPLSAIAAARTPTLILHGANDERVHPAQALEMYQALKTKGVDTELVMYPRASHGISERAHRIDILERQLAWFDKYVKGS